MIGSNDSASRGKLATLWGNVTSSFWFIPALLTLGGVVLSGITQPLDRIFQGSLDRLPTIISGGSEGAGSVLSAISGSLITVIATVFSLSIVSLTLASGQYSPRLLPSFVANRGLQIVLGVYIGTFVYSLIVLRLVSISGGQNSSFNPTISVAVAIILALVCVGLLIYFINHITQLIQSSTIVQMAHGDVLGVVSTLNNYEGDSSEVIGDPSENPQWSDTLSHEPSVIRARDYGYVQYLNVDAVLKAIVDERTSLVEIPLAQGNFVASGLPIVRVWPACGDDFESENGAQVNRCFVLGKERKFQQDFGFGLRQLSDIALKGLSPSTNDPTTAMQAMDRIEDIFISLGSKALPLRIQRREVADRKVLVKVGYPNFEDHVGLAFDQVRRAAFATGQVAVLERLLEILDRIARANTGRERQQAVWARIFTIARLAPDQIPDPEDATALMIRAVECTYGFTTAERVRIEDDLRKLTDLAEDLESGDRVRRAVEDTRKHVSR